MKNIETPDKKHLESIISDLREGRFGIPDFQRDFEWNPWDVTELIKSIFEDYYIGTLLLWKASRENIEYLSCKPIYGSIIKDKFQHIVLDGQQRLSALYYAFFAPNQRFPKRKLKYYYVIYIEKLLAENFDEAFDYIISSKNSDALIENEEAQFEQKLFPLKVFGERSHHWSRWLEKYQDYWIQKGYKKQADDEREKLEKILESILNEYYISYIELDREIEVEKVCDIFQRINSTGLDLNIFDLMNALLRPKEIKLKSLWEKEVVDFQTKLPDPDKGKIYTLQTMSILKQMYCAPKYLYYLIPKSIKLVKEGPGGLRKIILVESKEEFLTLWKESLKEMKNALKIINNHSDLGVINAKFFPYPTMLPIFTALNIEKAQEIYKDRKSTEEKIRYWYWASIFTKNYSSSVESQMTKDFIEMKKWFSDDAIIPSVVEEARKAYSNINLESEESQNSSIYKAIFCVLIKEKALDFITYEEPVYSELEDHHIVPKSWGNRNKIDNINSVLNRTPIANDTNKNIIRDRLPNTYIRDLFKRVKKKDDVYKMFESHLISRKAVDILLRDPFKEIDFKEFIAERKEVIIKHIKELIGATTELEQRIEKDSNNALNDLEKKLRLFISEILQSKFGPDYWKQGIPGYVKEKVEKRISIDLKKYPFSNNFVSAKKKLNYIDFSEYFPIISAHWELFEAYFINKNNCLMHFNNLMDYRNPDKHVREKNNIVIKLGEAAIEWILSIIEGSKLIESN